MARRNTTLPPSLKYEALSAITECEVQSIQEYQTMNPGKPMPEAFSPQDFVNLVSLTQKTFHESIMQLADMNCLYMSESPADNDLICKELFVNEEDFFDPRYDYDFTHIDDGTDQFKRGSELYARPCGWNRIALKVRDKYPDGNRWLGTGPDSWPVSYHGTSVEGAKGIIQSHYKPGNGMGYGRGVYSTPDISMALRYSNTFTSKTTGKTYNVIIQNRINPQRRKIPSETQWLVPVPAGTSSDEQRKIVESAIRPYGLLLREVQHQAC